MQKVGIDENGLGANLGPLIVSGVRLELSEQGNALLNAPLPDAIAEDLDDSKALVSHHSISLAEAWARAVFERVNKKPAKTPAQLFEFFSLHAEGSLRSICPKSAEPQCWSIEDAPFCSSLGEVLRVKSHLDWLEHRGVHVRNAKSVVYCTSKINQFKQEGIHRFAADLRGMEELLLAFRDEAPEPLVATCGKVGGIAEYGKYFSLLAGELFNILEEERSQSSYRFARLGTVSFIKDADARDPAVMLASLLGKYLRELTMQRIGRYYLHHVIEIEKSPSGYHDPVTNQFVLKTARLRQAKKIPDSCFERARAPKPEKKTKKKASAGTRLKQKESKGEAKAREKAEKDKRQSSLF